MNEGLQAFIREWSVRDGREKGEAQSFWRSLLGDVLSVAHPDYELDFELKVKIDGGGWGYIDAYVRKTRVLIEQKGATVDLDRPEKQSDGTMLTPFQQARRYAGCLAFSKSPRWIVVSNFREIRIHDLDALEPEKHYETVLLSELERDWPRLLFLADPGDTFIKKEQELSVKAGELVGRLYDALKAAYEDPDSEETLRSLNILCVRLVFCLYAEDALLFGRPRQFHDYMRTWRPEQAADGLAMLFDVLSTPEDERKVRNQRLLEFPYVNGGLFDDASIGYPDFTDEILDLICDEASLGFDWQEISPTIFGAAFESTLNAETRRQGGMHYTSVENINKVIDPLFMDGLAKEFEEIKKTKALPLLKKKLGAFTDRMSSLKFLDPACGSGNFLTETYIRLRRMENEALDILHKKGMGRLYRHVKISIGQFYGIEINDFAVAVARTALWIAETQMLRETGDIYHETLDCFPLKAYPNIVCANALTTPWDSVVKPEDLNYILGNPPFGGAHTASPRQKKELSAVFGGAKGAGELDYVAAWYRLAAGFMSRNSGIETAFVSTNSICQGTQVAPLWGPLLEEGFRIGFAYRTFRWTSDAQGTAAVHCVIVGLGLKERKKNRLFSCPDGSGAAVEEACASISPYLVKDASGIVKSESRPLSARRPLFFGNMPLDGGALIIEDADLEDFKKREPKAVPWIRKLAGSREMLRGLPRWCLWLVDAPDAVLRLPLVAERVERCRAMRLASRDAGTRKHAERASQFRDVNNPATALVVPRHSSERRRYVPFGYVDGGTIVADSCLMLPDADLYDFGIMTSAMHMDWMRTVCGRLKSDYRYSRDICWNTFPLPSPSDAQKTRIEELAKAVLNTREQHPDMCLAELYNPESMPADLKKAHETLDRAVDALYRPGKPFKSDEERLQLLFGLYEGLVKARNGAPTEVAEKEAPANAPKKRRGRRPMSADVQDPAAEEV